MVARLVTSDEKNAVQETRDPDEHWMAIALEQAAIGRGAVEPNPMVGCVLVRDSQELARGYHATFGEGHAEANALSNCRNNGFDPQGATAYVTLEPCCHHGKTPPCVDALLKAKVARVVIAMEDPFPKVVGGGISRLKNAGVEVVVGVLGEAARQLNRPYLKRVKTGMPWIIAKWAMTLDGKIATITGESQWISGQMSRKLVHELRARVDAIMIGSGTAVADDPMLTARLPNDRTPERVAKRVVFDSSLKTPLGSKLVATAEQIPVLFGVGSEVDSNQVAAFESKSCQILTLEGRNHIERLTQLLDHLGSVEHATNVLVEGGAGLLGGLLEIGQIDEVHVFMGSQIVGGAPASSPVGGTGIAKLSDALKLNDMTSTTIDGDIYVSGFVEKS